MKLKNLYLVSVAVLAGALASCNNGTETFENKLYINASAKTSTILLKPTAPTAEGKFTIALPQRSASDITISLKADPSKVETYNAAFYDKALELPAKHYSMEKTQVVIEAGSVVSDEALVKFSDLSELDRDKVYVLPVSIEQTDVPVLESSRTHYFVFKGAALINVVADMTNNLAFVTWSKPEVASNLTKLTAEALIRVSKFDKMLTTIMGIEGEFLLRMGDSGFEQNQLQLATKRGNLTPTDLLIPTNEWTHIAVTYDSEEGGKVVIYINGKNKFEGAVNYGPVNWAKTKTDEGNGFWIGHSYNRERFLGGEITECRVWNRVLSEEEINAANHFYEVTPGAEGLVSYWKFDEGAGTSIADYSGNDNHATALEPIKWNAVELPVKK